MSRSTALNTIGNPVRFGSVDPDDRMYLSAGIESLASEVDRMVPESAMSSATDSDSEETVATSKAVKDAIQAANDYADGKLSSVYTPKGSVQTYADLSGKEATANPGDVWDVADTGMNYSWTGEKWDELGPILSNIQMKLTAGAGISIDDDKVAIKDGGITTSMIGSKQVTGDSIADNTLENRNFSDNSIAGGRIQANTITGAANDQNTGVAAGKLAYATVGTVNLRDSAVTEDKLASGAVSSGKLSAALRTELSGKATLNDIPDVVEPSATATTGQVADAKATGDALAGKVSKSGDIMTGALMFDRQGAATAEFSTNDEEEIVTLTLEFNCDPMSGGSGAVSASGELAVLGYNADTEETHWRRFRLANAIYEGGDWGYGSIVADFVDASTGAVVQEGVRAYFSAYDVDGYIETSLDVSFYTDDRSVLYEFTASGQLTSRTPPLSGRAVTTGETIPYYSIQSLPAWKIGSGVLSADRIPLLSALKIAYDTLSADRIPSLPASKIGSGTLSWERLAVDSDPNGLLAILRGDPIFPTQTFEDGPFASGAGTSVYQIGTTDWYCLRAQNFEYPSDVETGNASVRMASSTFEQYVASPPITRSIGEVVFRTAVINNPLADGDPRVWVFLGRGTDYKGKVQGWPDVDGFEAVTSVRVEMTVPAGKWVWHVVPLNWEISPDDPRRLFIGRMVSDRGVDVFIDDITIYPAGHARSTVSTVTHDSALGTRFDKSVAYEVGDRVVYGGVIYECVSQHDAGEWNPDDFERRPVLSLVNGLQAAGITRVLPDAQAKFDDAVAGTSSLADVRDMVVAMYRSMGFSPTPADSNA